MLRTLVFVTAIWMATGPALGDDCLHFETGTGPALDFSADGASVKVDFDDWVEACPIKETTHPAMRALGLGFGSGWIEPMVAVCKRFTTQVSFGSATKDGTGTDLAVFYGQIFYAACE